MRRFILYLTKFLKNIIIIFFSIVILLSCKNDNYRFLPKDKRVCFQLINGKYISANRDYNNTLFANSNEANEWEVFQIEKKGNNIISIKTSLNYYVGYNNQDSVLVGGMKKINTTEKFILIPHKEYFELHTINGGNVALSDNQKLIISYSKPALIFKIKSASTLPPSLFSIRELNMRPFVTQLFLVVGTILLFFNIFKNLIKKNRGSLYTVLILGFILLYVIFNTKLWEKDKVIVSDTINYYAYLPAAFIFHDLSFSFIKNLPKDFNGHIWPITAYQNNKKITYIKGNVGPSLMYLPFFALGHLSAKIMGYTAYGYSNPYAMFLCIGAWFYAFLALLYLRKILLLYFNDIVTSFTLFSVVLATNLFYYVTIESGMTHVYSFFLFTIFIWLTIKWHNAKNWKTAIFIGLIFGLITLIRPTNGLLLIVFVLFGVTNFKSLKERVKLFWIYRTQMLMIFVFTLFIWVFQLSYWKYSTGSWLFFSYGQERFYFNNPHILDGLFSYRKGWLLYTPIMSFALIGIFFLLKKQKVWLVPIFIFTSLNIYVVYSWWCWWYGGSFGSRPMVDSYALLAIPLASFFNFFDKKTNYFRSIPLFIIFLASTLNLFQTQQTKTCLHYDSMTKEAYLTNFFTLGQPRVKNLLKTPDYENAVKGLEEYKNSPQKVHLLASNNKYVCTNEHLGDTLFANSDNPWEWETFILQYVENNDCTLFSSDSTYVSINNNEKGLVTAIEKKRLLRSTFKLIELGNNFIAIKAKNGKYLSLNQKSLKIYANSTTIGKNEKFELIKIK